MNFWLIVSSFSLFIFSINLFPQINTERYRQDADSGFSGAVEIEGLAQTGNTDFQLLSLGGRLNYNRIGSYSFFVFSGGYGWKDGSQFSNELISHLRNVESLNDFLLIEAFMQFDYNKKRKLLSRELIGAGLRYKILTTDYFKFRLGTSYFFEIEEYDLPDGSIHGKNVKAHRFSSYSTFEIRVKEDMKFSSVTYFQPDIQNFGDYRLISENILSFLINRYFDFNVKFNVRYDTLPPDGIKELDTITKLGITYKF